MNDDWGIFWRENDTSNWELVQTYTTESQAELEFRNKYSRWYRGQFKVEKIERSGRNISREAFLYWKTEELKLESQVAKLLREIEEMNNRMLDYFIKLNERGRNE